MKTAGGLSRIHGAVGSPHGTERGYRPLSPNLGVRAAGSPR